MDLISLSLRLSRAGTVTIPADLRREQRLEAGMHVRLLLERAPGSAASSQEIEATPGASIGLRITRRVDRLDSWSIQPVTLPPASDASVLLALTRAAALRGSSPRWKIEALLNRFAVSCRRRVLMGDQAESPEGDPIATSERQRLSGWQFTDGSYALRTRLTPPPATFVSVAPDGLGQSWMLDRVASLRAALRQDRTDLVALYVACHGGLPRLGRTLLLRALQSPNPTVRLAAFASMSRSGEGRGPAVVSPTRVLDAPPEDPLAGGSPKPDSVLRSDSGSDPLNMAALDSEEDT